MRDQALLDDWQKALRAMNYSGIAIGAPDGCSFSEAMEFTIKNVRRLEVALRAAEEALGEGQICNREFGYEDFCSQAKGHPGARGHQNKAIAALTLIKQALEGR